jgi:predicted nucleic-acid-binding Zn-ribbon protein
MAAALSPCPNCHSKNVFKSKEVSAGGGHAPNYLPGLGKFLATEKFHIVLCKDCGLARFFARPQATAKLEESSKWTRV